MKFKFTFSTGHSTIEVIGRSYEHALSIARDITGLNRLEPIGDGVRVSY